MMFHMRCESIMKLLSVAGPEFGVDEIYFGWEAEYLLKLKAAFCCSADCGWPFKSDAEQIWELFLDEV